MNTFYSIPSEILYKIARHTHYLGTLKLNMTCKYIYYEIDLKLIYTKLKELSRLFLAFNGVLNNYNLLHINNKYTNGQIFKFFMMFKTIG